MMWITHLLFGLVSYLLLARIGVFPASMNMIIAVSLGSIIPDIDHPKSYISHMNGLLQLSSRVISLGGHRGITHTLLAFLFSFPLAVLVMKFFNQFNLWIAIAFSFGWLSHLVADSLTRSGVKWLFPFDSHAVRWIIRTGSASELLVFGLLVVVALLLNGF